MLKISLKCVVKDIKTQNNYIRFLWNMSISDTGVVVLFNDIFFKYIISDYKSHKPPYDFEIVQIIT